MFEEKAILSFYAETPIHMGAGQAVSYVDLPVQRERITGFPTLWSSGIKGVIRELAERLWNNNGKVEVIFGPREESQEYASCISITDAKILLYPVRSVRGVFAWITCPFVLRRCKDDLKSVGIKFVKNNEEIQVPEPSGDDKVVVTSSQSVLGIDSDTVGLEEFILNVDANKDAKDLAEFIIQFLPQNELSNSLPQRIAIVSDDVFKDLVNYAVEVRTRIKIDQTTGTVQEGALFTEELIPSESIFYSLLFIANPYLGIQNDIYKKLIEAKQNSKSFEQGINSLSEDEKKVIGKINLVEKAYKRNYFTAEEIKDCLKFIDGNLLQLGGDETTGKGFMRVRFYEKSQT